LAGSSLDGDDEEKSLG